MEIGSDCTEGEEIIMIPLSVPNLSGNERKYLNECIDSTFVSSVGPFVTRLENEIANISGALYVIATSAGTTALHTALMSVGVGKDDLVMIPSFTFIATANAVAHCGAEPWCIDIDDFSWTMAPDILEAELKEKTVMRNGRPYHVHKKKKVAAIMPVYTLGTPADMDQIREIADRYGLPVVADAAAAIGAEYKGEKIGKLADATVYSFNGNKTVTCGGGGAIVTDNKEIAELARHLSTTARIGTNYDFDMVGYNYRMTNLQAAVGCAQLERAEEFVEKKREIRKFYEHNLNNLEGISFYPEPEWAKSSCWFSGIVIDSESKLEFSSICEHLKAMGIEGRPFWKPVHLQLPYRSVECSEMSVTERIWTRILTLPCSTGITADELQRTVEAVRIIVMG